MPLQLWTLEERTSYNAVRLLDARFLSFFLLGNELHFDKSVRTEVTIGDPLRTRMPHYSTQMGAISNSCGCPSKAGCDFHLIFSTRPWPIFLVTNKEMRNYIGIAFQTNGSRCQQRKNDDISGSDIDNNNNSSSALSSSGKRTPTISCHLFGV